ncbi:MAG: hypothetical protein PHX44_01350 [Sulfurimonas sp.]|uniref:PBECR3 domain-containing polyvalent protein n=1 Tax=Sulfurimonas sp. TaxID=2022749 RepID=UPI00261DF310|nr:hypothetical protein [Sulfurimonas sp.]MDD2651679.1 hypothetical protein [Sulfurimonas sp.]MDD3451490.1 hypothetical protein [Sulfurimonas sp.]
MSLKNILDTSSDSVSDGFLRGFASTGARTLSYTNALAKAVGFDAPFDEKKLSGLQQKLEETKEQILDKERTPERKAELEKLKAQSQKAEGTLDIIKSTGMSLGDTLMHPSEWTVQGVVENFSPSDPLNLAGLGAGGYLAKKGVTTLGKIGLGAMGGAAEGGVIGSVGEAANAYGKGDSDEEIKKAAMGGGFGGVATGGVMGAAVAPFSKPSPKAEPKPDNAKLFEAEEISPDDIIDVRKKAKEEPKPTQAQNVVNGVVEARAEAMGKSKDELLGEKPLELKEHSVSGDVFVKSKEMDEALAKAQEHPRFEELMSMREEVKAEDTRYGQNLEAPRHINHYNNGEGWQTDVTGASYSKNYNADFTLTKQDIKNIREGKLNDTILQKVNTDLSTLDNHPDYADARYNDPKYTDKPKEMSFDDWDEAVTLFQKKTSEDRAEINSFFDDNAEPMRKFSVENIQEEFNANSFKDPLGKDVEVPLKLIVKNIGNGREQYLGMLRPSIEKPLMVVEHNGADIYVKSFTDFDAVKKFAAVEFDGESVSFHIIETGKIDNRIKEGKIKYIAPDARFSAGSVFDTNGLPRQNPNPKGDTKTIPQTPQTMQGSIKGMFEKLGDKGVIHIFENSDLTTVFHESAHWLETTFTKDERVAFDEAFGGVEAGRDRSEAFAEGFVKWAATGDAPNTTIKGVFEKTRAFLKDVLATLLNSNEAKFKLTASQELFYRAVFGDEEAKAYFAKALEKREANKPKDAGVKNSSILYQDGESLSVGVVKKEFLKFTSKALNDGSFNGYFNLGVINKASADKIYKFTNGLINLAGYTREIKASEVRHIKNRHSKDLKYIGEIVNVLDNFEFAKVTSYKEKTGRTTSGVMLYMRHPDGVLVGVELRDFGNKKVELKTFYMGDKAKIVRDQELPLFLRLWADEDYRSKNPLPYRPDTHSDGFMDKSISQNDVLYQTAANASDKKQAQRLMPVYNFLSDFLRGQGKVGAVTKEALAKVHADKLYEALSRHLVYGGARADDVIDAFSAYKIEQSARGNKATEVYKHLEKLSKADRENLHLVLSGDAELSALKPELENTYKALRNIISQNAKELVELGELKADESIEHYLARTYQKDIQEATSLQNSLFASGGSVDHIKARRGKEVVMQMDSESAKELEVGDSVATKNSDTLFTVENITHGADGKAKIELHRDYTFAERSEMGEVRDAAFSVWYTLQKQNAQIARAKILQKIPTKMFESEEAAKAAGFEKVPDEATADRFKLYGALSGKHISKYDKADLDYYLNISHSSGLAAKAFGLSNAWAKGVTLMKLNDTVKNAATHLNNFMSNVFVMSLRDPMAFATLGNPKKLREAYKRIHELGLSDGEMPDIEAAMLKDFSDDTAKNTNFLLDMATRTAKELFLAKGTTLGEAARTLYRFEDALFKAMVFAKKTSEGMSEADAVAYLRDGYVDYTKPLPPAVRMLDRGGVLPFASFTVRSAPVAFRAIAENPVKFGLFVAALSASGLKPDEKENELLPFFHKGSGNIFFVPKTLVWDSEDGKYLEGFNVGRWAIGMRSNPLEIIDAWTNPLSEDSRYEQKLGYVGSLIKILSSQHQNDKKGVFERGVEAYKEVAPNYAGKLIGDLADANNGKIDKYSHKALTKSEVLKDYLLGKDITVHKASATKELWESKERKFKASISKVAYGDMELDELLLEAKRVQKLGETFEKKITIDDKKVKALVLEKIENEGRRVLQSNEISPDEKKVKFAKLRKSYQKLK